MRLLMTPDAEASGGGEAVVAEKPAETKAEVKPPPVAEAKVEPKGRFVPEDQWAEFERLRSDVAERKERERLDAEQKLIDKGKWEELVKLREKERDEERAAKVQLEARTKKSVLAKELATALSDPSLVKGAAAQLLKLWSDEFEVRPDGDEWRVETRDRKSPADFVREKLATEEFGHYIKADARGGAGAGGAKPTPAEDEAGKSRPGSVEAIAAQWKAAQKSHGANQALFNLRS